MTNTMAAQRNSKRKKLKVKAGNEPTLLAEKAKTETKSVRTRIKEQKRAIPKSRESLTKVQKVSQAAPRKVKQGHQAGIKRVSFIVRLTVDEHSQPGRTEIEHVPSGRKQNFPSLEAVRLVTFMKACIGPERISDDVIPTINTPEDLITSISAAAEPRANLIVSDVQVFRRGNPDYKTLILTPEEPFMLQTHFQIQVPDSQKLIFQESSFETNIYASEILSGNSQLLKTYDIKLLEDVSEYIVPIDLGGLPLGLYRLFTVVTLYRPIKLVGFYGKTFVHVG